MSDIHPALLGPPLTISREQVVEGKDWRRGDMIFFRGNNSWNPSYFVYDDLDRAWYRIDTGRHNIRLDYFSPNWMPKGAYQMLPAFGDWPGRRR